MEDEQHFLFTCPSFMLDKSMPSFSAGLFCLSGPFLSQVISLTLNQMHAVVFSGSVLHVENLLYSPDVVHVP